MNIEVTPIKPAIGAVVKVDKQTFLSAEFVEPCLKLLDKHTALVFPELGLTDAEQLAFTDRLGDRVNFTKTVPGGDEAAQDVYTITLDTERNTEPEYVLGSMFWHADGICSDIAPPKATLLSCHNPPDKGGQTEFCSTYAAWEALPEEEKTELEGLGWCTA